MTRKKVISKKTAKVDIKGEIIGIVLITMAVLTLFSIFLPNSLGMAGKIIDKTLFVLIGVGTFFMPFILLFVGISYIVNNGRLNFERRFAGILILISDFILFVQILNIKYYYSNSSVIDSCKAIYYTKSRFHGGIIGLLLAIPLDKFLGNIGCYIVLLSVLVISIIIISETSIKKMVENSKIREKKNDKPEPIEYDVEEKDNKENYINSLNKKIKLLDFMKKQDKESENEERFIDKDPIIEEAKVEEQPNLITKKEKEIENEIKKTHKETADIYEYPKIELLNINNASRLKKEDKIDLINNATKLKDTLKSFGVDANVVQVTKGPSVTRFELQPNSGVKVSKIVNLADDIALSLAASAVRIEAPIPGKAAVGIEVPNKELSPVFLREVVESNEFINSKNSLAFGLGKDIAGNCVVSDLAKMPHALIAGATGSGKSVCINTLIISILYKYTPEDVKLLMIDPKVVELSVYNGIPHLLIPVVTDPKKAAGALSWAVSEMTKRYQLFADNNVRNIQGYNDLLNKNKITEKLPFIVIIIDELADLMMVCPNDIEEYIARLAQMARAAGMHLVIATQRPSVDVITGVIKANIPTRISFAVSSQIDSRTILDMAGAEKLLGRGDMLFYPVGESKPLRIQGAFISEEEVEKVVDAIKKQEKVVEYSEKIIEEINSSVPSNDGNDDIDDLLEEAVRIVIDSGQASTSLLQRRLRIGYNRAARLIEQLEEQGVISGRDGSKPRQILKTRDL